MSRKDKTPIHQSASEKANIDSFLAGAEKLATPYRKTTSQAWNELEARLKEHSFGRNDRKTRRLNTMPILRIAAGLLLLACMGYISYLFFDVTRYTTGKGELLAVTMPDGSGATLNADSRLKYRKSSWVRDRRVGLIGEAYFDVTNGSSFTVTIPGGSVVVKGTRFNVFAREGRARVEVAQGKVEVMIKGSAPKTLKQGEALKAEAGLISPETFAINPALTGSWTKGDFFFENEPLKEVMAEVARQFNVTIDATGIEGRYYTGYFTMANLQIALEHVCLPMGLHFTIGPGKVVIIR